MRLGLLIILTPAFLSCSAHWPHRCSLLPLVTPGVETAELQLPHPRAVHRKRRPSQVHPKSLVTGSEQQRAARGGHLQGTAMIMSTVRSTGRQATGRDASTTRPAPSPFPALSSLRARPHQRALILAPPRPPFTSHARRAVIAPVHPVLAPWADQANRAARPSASAPAPDPDGFRVSRAFPSPPRPTLRSTGTYRNRSHRRLTVGARHSSGPEPTSHPRKRER